LSKILILIVLTAHHSSTKVEIFMVNLQNYQNMGSLVCDLPKMYLIPLTTEFGFRNSVLCTSIHYWNELQGLLTVYDPAYQKSSWYFPATTLVLPATVIFSTDKLAFEITEQLI